MEKFLKWCSVTLVGALLTIGIVGTLVVPVMATEDSKEIQPRTAVPTSAENAKPEVPPTFTMETDESSESARFWIGKNLLIAGNNINTGTSAANGLMFVAGNTLNLTSESEYGFIAGNVIGYAGETARDLFVTGNSIVLHEAANIGRDVYAAGNTLIVESNLVGDLSAAAATIELHDVKIAGNVNLDADYIKFTGNVEIAGALVYNETAEVVGLDQATYGSVEVYEVRELSPTARLVAAIYGKILSIAALFLIMALFCAIYPKTHDKISKETDANRFGIDLALGFGVLLIIPIIAFISFISFIVAPLGLVALALYAVMIYLSQGFAGVWLGHLILEKGFKSKGNIFAEAFIGILVLGLLSLIPYVGAITGFLGLLLGLGLILQCIKPAKDSESKVSAKFNSKAKH